MEPPSNLEGSDQRSQNTFWRASTNISANLYAVIVRLPWVIAIAFIGAIVIQGLTQQTTVIKDISVPKILAEAGYTSDVAGHRMRDALYELKKQARTEMRRPEVALAGELPAIVVPTVGISLDAIVSSLRTLFRSTRSRTITGEVTINKDLLWLVLRIDGEKFYQSESGVAQDKPDDLFKAAAANVMSKIKPYVAVAALADEKPEAALLMAQQMLSRLPPDDEEIAWLHNLRAAIYLDLKDNLNATEALELASTSRDLPIVRMTRGRLLESLGKHEEATAEFVMAVKKDQTNPTSHLQLGDYYRRQNKIDAAIAEFQKAHDLDRTNADPHIGLGVVFLNQNKFDAAIAEFQKAIGLDPKNAGVHRGLGLAFASKDDSDGAIAEYQKAIGLDPKDAIAHTLLGDAFYGKGDFDATIAEYQKAIGLDPKNAVLHGVLGLAFAKKNNFDAAIAEYQKAIDLDPKKADSNYYLGLAFEGNSDAAIAEYQRAIDLHYNLGLAFAGKGNFDAAIANFQTAIDLDPKNAAAHNYLGLALASKRNFDAAIPEFQIAIDLNPKDAYAHYHLGLAFAERGNSDAAIPEFQTAIALDLDSKDWAHRSLGLAFASKGNFDAAIPEYQKAIDLDPKDTTNFDAAIAEYERKKTIDLDLTDARPRTNLGNVLKDAGD